MGTATKRWGDAERLAQRATIMGASIVACEVRDTPEAVTEAGGISSDERAMLVALVECLENQIWAGTPLHIALDRMVEAEWMDRLQQWRSFDTQRTAACARAVCGAGGA